MNTVDYVINNTRAHFDVEIDRAVFDQVTWTTAHNDLHWGNVTRPELCILAYPDIMPDDIVFPAEDCWLFDDNQLVLSLFKPEGGSGGFAQEYDPALIEQCKIACNQAWLQAVPYAEYVAR